MDLLSPLNHWHWWILATVLGVAELLLPGIFFVWLGVAAAVTGFVALAADPSWEAQVLVFAVLAVISAVIGRRIYRRAWPATDHPMLNRRGQQHVGQVLVLDAAIANGSGRVRVGDSTWKVAGPDCPAGSHVRVVAVEGVTLQVEPAPDQRVS